MRIVSWNIRAGGGARVPALLVALARWRPEVVALSEFRATRGSAELARVLATRGLRYQCATCSAAAPAANALLLASRWPLRPLALAGAPVEPGRWLAAAVDAPRPLALGLMHAPNRVTGRKYGFLDAVLHLATRWRHGPSVLLGDTNSGCRGLDEETACFNAREEGWITALGAAGWTDAFRHLHGERRAYTWYSPNGGNGFRIDQAFVHRSLLPNLVAARHVWGGGIRRRRPSDHAALLLDLG
ncbi:MAG: endonuclease/exonuclease/phosphatase family protein [Candidatus Rokubacteria bacterium]|nr:endonuclease/exonuclease/phosphatase family protein [Candidatus Rokubacteria bacterium]